MTDREMNRYLLIRDWHGLDPGGVSDAARQADEVRSTGFPELGWEHSHFVHGPSGVRSFCVYTAPDEGPLRAHAAAVGGHTIVAVKLAGDEVRPEDFGGS